MAHYQQVRDTRASVRSPTENSGRLLPVRAVVACDIYTWWEYHILSAGLCLRSTFVVPYLQSLGGGGPHGRDVAAAPRRGFALLQRGQ